MFSSKDKIVSFLMQYTKDFTGGEIPAVSTQFLSEQLHMQRTYISRLLNQLMLEGIVVKRSGRPVLYQLKSSFLEQDEETTFQDVIGYDASLQEVVKQVKARLLWPYQHHMVIFSQVGCGVQHLCDNMYAFAIQHALLDTHAPYQIFDCFIYVDRQEELHEALFTKVLPIVNKGILLIKNINILSGFDRSLLFAIAKGNREYYESYVQIVQDYHFILLCSMPETVEQSIQKLFCEQVGCSIHLPSLQQRSRKERFALLQKFIQEEAKNVDRTYIADRNIIQDLLLYPCVNNIKGLRGDILQGCANAYVRCSGSKQEKIVLHLSDFPNVVRKGILYYKEQKNQIDELLGEPCMFVFHDQQMTRKPLAKEEKIDVYHKLYVQEKANKKENLSQDVRSAFLENDFYNYVDSITQRVHSQEQLERFVSQKLISLVSSFLENALQTLHKSFDKTVFYGLCLHINKALVNVGKRQYVDNSIIKEVIQQHEQEYMLTKSFVEIMKQEFGVQFSIDEVIFIILLLCKEPQARSEQSKVVTLIVLHGDTSATSIANVVNQMIPDNTVYAYDIPLDKRVEDVYDGLKQQILEIHQGKGILLIYDMGSIRTMCASIAVETSIEVRYFEMPLTLIGIACAKETKKSDPLDEIYARLQDSYQDYLYKRKVITSEAIILLQHSYEQDAQEIMDYVQEHYHTTCTLLSVDDRNDLFNELNQITKQYTILGIIGTYDPHLAHLPFCSLEKFHAHQGDAIKTLFQCSDKTTQTKELKEVMSYLQEQFQACDMTMLQPLLLQFLDDLQIQTGEEFTMDQKIGITIHVSCLIERLLQDASPTVNFEAASIYCKYKELVGIVLTLLKPMEQCFHIVLNDSEAAIIVSIIKQ